MDFFIHALFSYMIFVHQYSIHKTFLFLYTLCWCQVPPCRLSGCIETHRIFDGLCAKL